MRPAQAWAGNGDAPLLVDLDAAENPAVYYRYCITVTALHCRYWKACTAPKGKKACTSTFFSLPRCAGASLHAI